MDTQKIGVPQLAFFGDSALELELPASWEVQVRAMPGADLPAIPDKEIRAVLADPTGTPPLRDLAQGKHEAVIIFDDISRPTPVHRLWPFVVDELHAAGLEDKNIRMIVALGTHAAHSRTDFVRKLGEEALQRFPVYNHNCYQHNTLVGTTSKGTPIEVNDEVLACDLRIAIGSVLPHPSMGFGGGPKIILPGVVSYDTIMAHHGPLMRRLAEEGYGPMFRQGMAENVGWQDIAEAAGLAELDFVVNSVLNQRREVVGIVAGHFVEAWREGVEIGKRVYATEPVADADVIITNGYAKGNEAMISAYSPFLGYGAPEGGRDVVAISNNPQGVVVHYLSGDFGEATWADRPRRERELAEGIRRMVVFNPYPEMATRSFFDHADGQTYVTTWQEVLDLLNEWHPAGANAAVYPDLTMQYLWPKGEDGQER